MSSASSTVAPRADPQSEANFRVADLMRVVRERSGLIRTVAMVVIAVTLVVLLVLPTLYSTSASVMLDPRKNNVADLSSVLSQLPTDPASLQNQIQILTSRDLALQVIAKLKLYDDPEFNHALRPGALDALFQALDPRAWGREGEPEDAASARDKIVDAFLKNLAVETQGLSTTLTVTYTSRDPDKAALIANTLVDTYIDDQLDSKRQVGDRTTAWLLGRTHELSQLVQAQEAAVQRYKADNNLTETADGSSLADQQISAISNQLVQAKTDLAAKQATNDRVAALIKAGDTADVSQILASPLIVQLRTQQALLISQESELTTRYGPRHPKMEAVETQKRDLQEKIATEVSRLAGSIGNDVAVSRAQVASLQGSLAQAEKLASNQNLVRVKLRALQSNAQSTRTMYEAFVTRLRETQDQDVIQNPDAQVISRAPVPTAPSSPKRLLILAASIPGGLLIGLLAALMAERLAGAEPVRPLRDVRRDLVLRDAPRPILRTPLVLARVDGAFDPRAGDAVLDWPGSAFAHSIAALLAQLMAPSRRQGARVVALTSTQQGPAKTAIAVALARTAARRNLRVAVIDADLNRPAAARIMGIGPQRFGLLEVLVGTSPASRAFCRDPRSPALVLSPVQPLHDPHAVLASAKMAAFIAHLRRNCDLVLIDGPALPAGAELASLARLSDGVVVVARDPSPGGVALGQAMAALEMARIAPLGFVVAN